MDQNQEKSGNTTLRYVTLAVIIGVMYLFLLRGIGSIFTGLFSSPGVAQVTQVVALVALAILVLFFYLFYKNYCRPDQGKLRSASTWAMVGALLILVSNIRGVMLLFGQYMLFRLGRSVFVEMLFPLVGVICILYFFVIFRSEVIHIQQTSLYKPITIAIIGHLAQLVMIILTSLNYILFSRGMITLSVVKFIGILFVLLVITYYTALLYFYSSFYIALKPEDKVVRQIIQE